MHILKPFLGKTKNVNTKHVLEQSYETFPAKRNYGCRNQPTLMYMSVDDQITCQEYHCNWYMC